MNETSHVGLVVHYSETNYGNQLVNYATKRILESGGSSVDLIVFRGGQRQLRVAAFRRVHGKILRLLADRELVDRVVGRVRRFAERDDVAGVVRQDFEARRVERIREFAAGHLSPVVEVRVEDRWQLDARYDHFVVGSDQIWNYDYGLGPWYFLDFAERAKRACLAPSIGHSSIPREWASFYRDCLSGFDEVSVRESHWVSDLSKLAPGVPISLLVDPTLMLDDAEWGTLTRARVDVPDYLLVYELGEFSEEQGHFVRETARVNGLEVRWLSQRKPDEGWVSDPSDFLSEVKNAACVVTDSFHGAVFSFLFDRALVIVRREGFASEMNARIDTLVAELHLADRLLDQQAPESALAHDYSVGRAALVTLREVFWRYLARHGLATRGTAEGAAG